MKFKTYVLEYKGSSGWVEKTILEIKQKKAIIQMRGKQYRVPLSMLEEADI